MADHRVQALAVLRGRTPGRTQGGADHDRRGQPAAGHVVDLGRLVSDLVQREKEEVAEHDVDDRPHSGHRRAEPDAGEAGLGNWRVHHPLGPKLIDQAAQNLERRAGLRHVFAHDKDARIAAHLFRERLADCFGHRDLSLGHRLLRHRHAWSLLQASDMEHRART